MPMDDHGNWIPPGQVDYRLLARATVEELERSRSISNGEHIEHHEWIRVFKERDWEPLLEHALAEYKRKQERRELWKQWVMKPLVAFVTVTGVSWFALKVWAFIVNPIWEQFEVIINNIPKGGP